jgi:starch phosphorylase
MWRHLWPGVAEEDVPITSVTNGVHVPTWISRDMSEVFTTRLAADWRARLGDSEFWKGALRLPDRLLWKTRGALRARLVDFVRARVASQLERTGSSAATIRRTTVGLFDPEVFTIGFARRFALYKRAALLFRDAATARDLFESKRRPLQIVFAGKPHPEDPQGKRLFEEVVAISRRRPFRGRVVVIENYDMDVGRALVQGVDLWLNNPRRPLEASGTSGQKVPFNGGLNLSVLDGWWDEGYEPDAGWAIGERREYHDPGTQDAEDAASLYRVLTREVVPLFYARDRQGVPHEWLRRVKRSMATHIPRFSTVAMLGNYVRKLYEPAAESGRRLESRPALARDLVEAREQVRRCWPMVHQTAVRERRSRKQVRVGVEFFVAGLGEDQLEVRAQLNGSEDLAPVEVVRTRDAALEFQFDLPARARGPLRVTLWPRHAAGLLAETGLSCEVAW